MNGMIRDNRLCSTVSLLTDCLYFTRCFIIFEGFNVLRYMLSVAALLTSSQVLHEFNRSFHYVIMHYFLLDLIVFKIQHGFYISFYALSFQYY